MENYTPYLVYKIKIKSGSLWSVPLTEKQVKIYREIKRLRKEGLTYKQISDDFNERGWTTTRGCKFSDGGVHSSEWKMEKRIKKMEQYEVKITDLDIEFDYDIDIDDE